MTLSEFRSMLKETLQACYSKNELDQLAKHLLMNRLKLDSTSYLLAADVEMSEEVLMQLRSDIQRL